MIQTKSIFLPKEKEDGTRLCVMYYTKPIYQFDEWERCLAPSYGLLKGWREYKITWGEFVERYISEMSVKKEVIKKLKQRSDAGEVITLLCWEKNDLYCHRRLLQKLIEECIP